jgi:hypothetical protein
LSSLSDDINETLVFIPFHVSLAPFAITPAERSTIREIFPSFALTTEHDLDAYQWCWTG